MQYSFSTVTAGIERWVARITHLSPGVARDDEAALQDEVRHGRAVGRDHHHALRRGHLRHDDDAKTTTTKQHSPHESLTSTPQREKFCSENRTT